MPGTSLPIARVSRKFSELTSLPAKSRRGLLREKGKKESQVLRPSRTTPALGVHLGPADHRSLAASSRPVTQRALSPSLGIAARLVMPHRTFPDNYQR